MEFAVKYKKPIMVISDAMDPIPQLPDAWKPFEKILAETRGQVFSAYYTTEMAQMMQSVRKDPTNHNSIRFYDAKYYSK